ncbi:MAG: Gfo/Idh/MocA family oxidoreductase [Planctomycetaceae bacterium]|nr:Gfo/Idh/MocA family oxidoreductase [Planctomycetaceae bacterium]MBT4013199.1 Gfo/Idh/MocA family oxidoreductase [Planctomycetaceae bacterium]MBT4723771.1 Gfo/Idh/MocA family oxidoreductase [Planctomycetaceae bacterium]MBT4847024.1 Gfo/Idh/MocA family oxidoreductase [Planctomycetaceae bacterium]MBT5126333.1 Gfo/Idh/MocA family oxidoreductase [Planctomycetaceae bacterium]
MTLPLKLAFIGVDNPHGAGWRDLIANVTAEATITSIVPMYGGTTASLQQCYVNLPRYASITELISNEQFDAAVICLPNDQTVAVVQQLAAAGKHLLLEKPGAGRVRDAEQIKNAVDQAGIAFQSGYMFRYDQCANRLRQMVSDEQFGKLISIESKYVTSDINRRGRDHYLFDETVSYAGFFSWLACHHLDLLLYITDQSVKAITARVGVFGDIPATVEDGGTALLDMEHGALATITGGYWVPRWAGEMYWTLRGSERWVHWDPRQENTGGVLKIHGPQPQWYAMEDEFIAPTDDTPGYGGANGVALLRDWYALIRGEVTSCRNTTQSMIDTVRLIEHIITASAEGRRIDC